MSLLLYHVKRVEWDAIEEKELEKEQIPQLDMQIWIHRN